MSVTRPGLMVLFGSGETAASSGKTYEFLAARTPPRPQVAILETPAGFELNSDRVASRVANFLLRRLQNYGPQVQVIPARQRGTLFSPDNREVLRPLLTADWLFLGAGSPTYTVRQLQNSLAWYMLLARYQAGASLILASAATIAFSQFALPVYEIYKAGWDLHWQLGLDWFGLFGLSVSVIPHWNNSDGGEDLDTSRCFMGQTRFAKLQTWLPAGQTVVGIEEHTALVLDPTAEMCLVMGNGRVVIWRDQVRQEFATGQAFPCTVLGTWRLPAPGQGVPADIWADMLTAQAELTTKEALTETAVAPTDNILSLVEARANARASRNWATADALRAQIATLGWQVLDTPAGPRLAPLP